MFGSSFPSGVVERLQERVSGSVLTPDSSDYDTQRKPWLQVVDQHPSVIVNARTTEDIAETLRVAREFQLPLGVQHTGHGIAVACNQGILLRLAEMNKVSVDVEAATATLGPGVCSGDLLAATEPHGLIFPTGQVSKVGVIGYTLGGGYGWLGREFGVASAHVLSATVVLADASVIHASAQENAELFWALRGGGGNFGVVAEMTVQLQRQPAIFGGTAFYRVEDAAEVLRFYKEWSASLSNATSTYLRVEKLPPKPNYLLHLHGTTTCAIGVCHTDLATAETLHRQITSFKQPAIDDLKVRPYSELASFDAASNNDHAVTYTHVECLNLTEEVINGVLAILRDHVPPLVILELQHLGGALRESSPDQMAYTAPEADFYFKLVSPNLSASLEDLAPIAQEAIHSMRHFYTGEYSYNWLRGDQQNVVAKTFGVKKFAKLKELKRRYDPENLLRLNLNISPD